MKEIIPAIMPRNFYDLKEKMSLVDGFVSTVQIDLCDGIYVHTKTWPYHPKDENSLEIIFSEEEGMPFWETLDLEIDCMVKNPIKELETIIRFGPKRIVFHLKSLDNPKEFFENLDAYIKEQCEIGLAILPDTNISEIENLIEEIDFIQCMGIDEIGVQGNPFDKKVLEQIREIKNKYPEMIVSVDGGVNQNTIGDLNDAGVDRFVIGSAIFNTESPGYTAQNFIDMI